MERLEVDIDLEAAGNRIDSFLAQRLEGFSRSYLQDLIKKELVFVNGQAVKNNYRLREGDAVALDIPPMEEPQILPEDIPLDILYEDRDLLVINKPKQMVVHPAPGHYTNTLVNALLFYCKGELSGINGVLRPGIVHRIDMDTTGLLVVCKNDAAHQSLATQLAEHTITRRYEAIVVGNLRADVATIDRPLGRSFTDRKKIAIQKKGKRAVTHYKVLERFLGFTHIECQLETGRTHQIRVHMASVHHPILGDTLYGSPKPGFALQGQCLHARLLGFIHPSTGEYMEFDAPPPRYFQDVLEKLRQRG